MNVKEYFDGHIKAWGIERNWRGKVSRFDINMDGEWKNDQGILTQHFSYYDGKKQKRVWKVKKVGENHYAGEADDVIGKSSGNSNGSACNWMYEMEVPMGENTYHMRFDDWM